MKMLYLIAKTLNIKHNDHALARMLESALRQVREADSNMCKCTKTFHCIW